MNILLMSNSPGRGYGYSVVSDHISLALKKAGHNVYYFGMQSIHPPYVDKDGIVNLGVRYDPWASDILGEYFRIYKIDYFLSIFDIWLGQTNYIGSMTKNAGVQWLAHVTANSYPLSPFLATPCSQTNIMIAPSKFVYNTLQEVFSNSIPTFYIPHGVDLDIYKPLPDEEKKRTKERLRVGDKEFIVLSVMRNKGMQKDFPTLFEAWKLLLEKIPKLKEKGTLLCLTDMMEPDGVRLDLLRNRMGLANNVRFVWAKPGKDGTLEATYEGNQEGLPHTANLNFSPEEMARLYNIADCHVVSSNGESFNLPTLEAMACGIPVIAGNHTTGPELVGESRAGMLANIRATTTTPLISDIFYVDQNNLMECMKKMYEDEKFREECSKNGLESAKKYSWETVAKRWVNFMNAIEYIRAVA